MVIWFSAGILALQLLPSLLRWDGSIHRNIHQEPGTAYVALILPAHFGMERYFTEQVYFVFIYRWRQTFGTKERGEALVKDEPGLGPREPRRIPD